MNNIYDVINQLNEIILGKSAKTRLALTCLLANGHLLIEDLPGVGKTTLAHALAKLLGLHFQRIQFTSDLLPSDIIGVSIFERQKEAFSFHQGPIFAQLVLTDEVNRATPKTQSALLEVMEEYQVTVDGETHILPKPFFVIATQNPTYQIGTFPLPESQLDRFLMRISLGYPDNKAERALLEGKDRRELLTEIKPCITPEAFIALQQQVNQVRTSTAILDYIQALLNKTRSDKRYGYGLSPRAGLALLHCAKAWAFLEKRDFIKPDDIQAIFVAVAGHRLESDIHGGDLLAQEILDSIDAF